MFGEEKLNNHYFLRYALTKEFFDEFNGLNYSGIELPTCLVRHFHLRIKEFVDENISNEPFLTFLKLKHPMQSVRDAQQALSQNKPVRKKLYNANHYKTYLMPGRFVQLALDHFSTDKVVFTLTSAADTEAIKGKKLPGNFSTFQLGDHLPSVHLPAAKRKQLSQFINKKESLLSESHFLFKDPSFFTWLRGYIFRMAKMVHVYESLILKEKVGVIIDHVDITVPGCITSLIGLKYDIPYVSVPQVLMTDRSIIPSRAAKYLVWGKMYKAWLIKRGIHTSKIEIVGNMNFEYARQKLNTSIDVGEFKRKHNIPQNHYIATWTTQPFEKAVNEQVLDWLKKTEMLPLTFIIRPHPSDNSDYKQLAGKKGNFLILSREDMELYDNLYVTDFLLTISSNTAIEAAIMKKPLIVLKPRIPYHYELNNNSFNYFLENASAGIVVKESAELKREIERLIQDKAYYTKTYNQGQSFLKSMISPEKSPSMVISRILRELNEKKST
ncbi:CDP-glycerol glycerophosphotransferase family protein [Bacillus sp. H-16]|uniref:CDP-glycerol glycerophosphotransferase family protein n=1 Tax=Alteribacter salitolerans TaxID=2912333 RepID=UPI001964CDF5|nr:CDP-glycerol glycerophosphotransferase family protein [Alteribacter salitolerans]MBM7094957.1 CDP-glycerol glycerophosphotransferase family protein [Alteribacter salitolerans]